MSFQTASKANVVHLGDDFFVGRFPFIDLDNGGSVQGLTKNIGDIIAKLPADVKIIPGHGALSTLKDLKDYHQMLIETTDAVQKGMMSGKALEGLKKDGLPAKYKSWAKDLSKRTFGLKQFIKVLRRK